MQAFNLRGTNGSGKTYVGKALLVTSNAKVFRTTVKKTGGRKPLLYRGELFNLPFYVFGSYETYCGGCDTIPAVSIVGQLLAEFLHDKTKAGLVFYEGLMISHMIGTVGSVAALYNEQHTMGFLDTPMKVCIQRVRDRRVERGNLKPFDPNKTLVGDYRAVELAKANAIRQGFRVVTVPYETALLSTLEFLKRLAELQCATSPKKSSTG